MITPGKPEMRARTLETVRITGLPSKTPQRLGECKEAEVGGDCCDGSGRARRAGVRAGALTSGRDGSMTLWQHSRLMRAANRVLEGETQRKGALTMTHLM